MILETNAPMIQERKAPMILETRACAPMILGMMRHHQGDIQGGTKLYKSTYLLGLKITRVRGNIARLNKQT